MIFLDLSEDVINRTLCLCDISSVIRISQTNKYLNNLAFAPSIWISLVQELRNRGFVDRLPAAEIQTMSTRSLVAVVRRLVLGPEAWSPASPRAKSLSGILHKLAIPCGKQPAEPSSVKACMHIVLNPTIPPALRPSYDFQVLPGGTYALFSTEGDAPVLGCWRVADNSLLGTYHFGVPSTNNYDLTFGAEVLHGGERANIAICVTTTTPTDGFVEVITWDFATGVIELHSVLPGRVADPCPTIGGDFAVLRAQWPSEDPDDPDLYIVIDWRAGKYCKILYPHTERNCIQIIPGYLIFTWSSNGKQEIRVVPIVSLSQSGSWTPVVEHNAHDPVLLSTLPHVASHTVKPMDGIIKHKGGIFHSVRVGVHESPLQYGTYRLWFYIGYYHKSRVFGGYTRRALLCRFRLSLPGTCGRQFTWQQQRCAPARTDRGDNYNISYSGHSDSAVVAGTHRIFPPDIHSPPIILETPRGSWSQLWSSGLAPYSGAVEYVAQQTLVLSYFK
ncbi:hypothetical protein C8R44DRAFT_893826 [Mycena epipterygia]|nr:hypothetical protein C8R44DRAFT_893826 [Mycena epipterygia]